MLYLGLYFLTGCYDHPVLWYRFGLILLCHQPYGFLIGYNSNEYALYDKVIASDKAVEANLCIYTS